MACIVGATLAALDMEEDDRSEAEQLMVDMVEDLTRSAAPGTPIISVTISRQHERLLRSVVGDDEPLLLYGVEPTIGAVERPIFEMGGTA